MNKKLEDLKENDRVVMSSYCGKPIDIEQVIAKHRGVCEDKGIMYLITRKDDGEITVHPLCDNGQTIEVLEQ